MRHENFYAPPASRTTHAEVLTDEHSARWPSKSVIAVLIVATVAAALTFSCGHMATWDIVAKYPDNKHAAVTASQPAAMPADKPVEVLATTQPAPSPAPANATSKEADGNVVDMTY